MDVRHLKQILSIHAHGSFGKAADDLGIAQPTLSKSIARLEDELGFQLFHRSTTGAAPTPEGLFVLHRARTIVAESSRLTREVGLMAAGELGHLRIGCGPALTPAFLPPLARALVETFPTLRVAVTVEARETLLSDLMSGRKDLLLAGDGPDLDAQGLHKVEILRDRIVAVASPSHPLARRSRLTVAEVAGHRIAHSAAGMTLRELFTPADQTPPRFVSNDYSATLALVAHGLAVGVFVQHLIREELERGQLVQLDIDLGTETTIVAAMTPAAAHSPVLQRIVRLARDVGEGFKAAI